MYYYKTHILILARVCVTCTLNPYVLCQALTAATWKTIIILLSEESKLIALANDHTGVALKKEFIVLLKEMNLEYKDFGAMTEERTDYALYGYPAALAVASGECEKGILVCGTGIGMSLTANKVKGIRCAACSDCYSAMFSRQHNNANMLALGARIVGSGLAKMIVKMWLETSFEGGRHQLRLDHINQIEAGKVEFLCKR